MKVKILTDHLYLPYHYSLHGESKYKLSVKISTFIATLYLRGILIRNDLVASLRTW